MSKEVLFREVVLAKMNLAGKPVKQSNALIYDKSYKIISAFRHTDDEEGLRVHFEVDDMIVRMPFAFNELTMQELEKITSEKDYCVTFVEVPNEPDIYRFSFLTE